MNEASSAAARVAARFDTRFLRGYVRSKLQTDPLYEAVWTRLQGHSLPLLDLGCGVGVLSFFLRERGYGPPVLGIDHDDRKITAARAIGSEYPDLSFSGGDVRQSIDFRGSVLLLDVLHYFRAEQQAEVLRWAAACVPSGGMVIIRDCIRDGSWRFRVTWLQEATSRAIRWLRAERLNFPSREEILAPFEGFQVEVTPLWGRTPFNNYLFVFRRP